MRMRRRWAHVVGCALVWVMAIAIGGCGSTTVSKPIKEAIDDNTTDQMYNDDVHDAELYVFPYQGKVITVDEPTTVNIPVEELEEGKFYKVIADVTYLNGGVAGYVNYPQINSVTSCTEVDPFDMGLPSIEDGYYGLTLIGDYADGDLFFCEMRIRALWKDGAWLYSYDKDVDLDDGTEVCCNEGVTEEQIRAGMADGILSCEDYFVLPHVTS